MNRRVEKGEADTDIPHGGISLKEAFGLLSIHKSLDLNTILKEQISGLKEVVEARGLSFEPKHSVSFVIPLDAYLPLPKVYHAALALSERPDTCTSFSVVSIASYTLHLRLEDEDMPVRLSVAIASIPLAEGNKGIDEVKDLHKLYQEALRATNNIIASYKLTPWRHSHYLHKVTALGSPGNLWVIIFNIPSLDIVSEDKVLMHDHFKVDIWESREMREVELNNFIKIHTSMEHGWSMPLWLASKVSEAINARCVGKDDNAVILADHYAELTMRFLLFEVLRSKGSSYVLARSRIKGCQKVDVLVSELAKALNYSPPKFKKETRYSVWKQSCRNLRNRLNHEMKITTVTPQQSFKALDSTLIMINEMCKIVNIAYPSALQDTQWLMSMTWITESIKRKGHARSATDFGRYNPDFRY